MSAEREARFKGHGKKCGRDWRWKVGLRAYCHTIRLLIWVFERGTRALNWLKSKDEAFGNYSRARGSAIITLLFTYESNGIRLCCVYVLFCPRQPCWTVTSPSSVENYLASAGITTRKWRYSTRSALKRLSARVKQCNSRVSKNAISSIGGWWQSLQHWQLTNLYFQQWNSPTFATSIVNANFIWK
jgi:hypothetical protein